MTKSGYKKYMKKNAQGKDFSLIQLFIISFFGMLLVFTFLIKSFSPSVDVSIGDYKQEPEIEERVVNVDDRLTAIQDEDQGKSFVDLMKKADDIRQSEEPANENIRQDTSVEQQETLPVVTLNPNPETVYKVFIGTYTSAEQAKVAKDIIQETSLNLNPIVKCIGSNNYTLQVGIFKNKSGAEAMLSGIKQMHLPGRIIQED